MISVFRLITYTAFSRSRPPSPHHTHTTYRPSNLPNPSSVHRMYHRTPTATRPSLMPLGGTKTSVWRCCVRRGRRSRRRVIRINSWVRGVCGGAACGGGEGVNLRQYTCNAQGYKTTSVPFYVPSIAPSRHCWFSLSLYNTVTVVTGCMVTQSSRVLYSRTLATQF